jgi:hypothetical protein
MESSCSVKAMFFDGAPSQEVQGGEHCGQKKNLPEGRSIHLKFSLCYLPA